MEPKLATSAFLSPHNQQHDLRPFKYLPHPSAREQENNAPASQKMKTSSRHSPTNALSRRWRDSQLLRRLKAHVPASPKAAAPAYCAAKFDLSYTERTIPEIQIIPPPPSYHESIPLPAVRDVARFKPVIHEPKPNQRPAYSVASLSSQSPSCHAIILS